MEKPALKSIITKVVLQMSAKVGAALWRFNMPLAGAMVVGVDVHHDTENNTKSVAGYCATTDSDFTHYYSR